MSNIDGAAPCLLDLVPGASAAFGLRRLRAGLRSQSADLVLRVERVSDARTADFAATPDGGLDGGALDRFLAGSVGRLNAWYDQSGYRNHAKPAPRGPLLAVAGDNDGRHLRFDGSAALRALVTLEGLSAFSLFAAFRAAHLADARSVARWQQEGNFVVFPYHTGDVLLGRHNAAIDAVPLDIEAGNFAVYGLVWRQGASDGVVTYRNGTVVGRRAARAGPIQIEAEPLYIGAYGELGERFRGDLVEIVIWPRALSSAEVQTVCRNMRSALPPMPAPARGGRPARS